MNVYLFDLDGTLVDSIGDIASCANIVRDSYGLPPIPEERIFGFIGNGSRFLMARTLVGDLEGPAPSDEVLDEAVKRWISLYAMHMMDRTRLFPGIMEALLSLDGPCAVVTNKPGESARQMCARAGLDKVCGAVVGMFDPGVEEGKPSADGIRKALTLVAPGFDGTLDRAVMVGDSPVDGGAAAAAQIPFVGVTWGLGKRDELLAAGACSLCDEPARLGECLKAALKD